MRIRSLTPAGLVLALSTLLASCLATPQPEPPSADVTRMTLTSTQPDRVRLDGAPGAIGDVGAPLRVSAPRTADAGGRVEVPVAGDGSFSAELAATLADVLYLELVEADGDRFLVAVGSAGDGVAEAPPGADDDGDGSPDAIDCDPGDASVGGRECAGAACTSDSDCAAGAFCAAGTCSTCMPAEICRNGLDDDCNGLVDDGC